MLDETNVPLSIKKLLESHNELLKPLDGLPYVGSRPNGQEFYTEVKRVKDAFNLYGVSENLLNPEFPQPPKEKIRLGMGSPAAFPPFPPAKERIIELIEHKIIHEYPLAGGDEKALNEFIEYLMSIGFKNNSSQINADVNENSLSQDNVIFTSATTQAFDLILRLICRQNDIVLMTAPNYGLFSFMPERIGARVELISLKEKNDWLINPKDLAKRIDILNHKHAVLHGDKPGSPPRVSAFLNMNPHNPLGKVMGNEHIALLSQIGNICLQKGVFVIDDLVYRDLTFNRDNLAVPLSSITGMFKNTISLFSLSKAYGMAGIRAGAVVADERIIRGLRNSIFQSLDSISTLQVAAMAGAFNVSTSRNKAYDDYFSTVIPEYKYRYNLVKALVDGIESIDDEKQQVEIMKDVLNYAGYEKAKTLLQGINGVCMANGTSPEAGFFAMLDFSSLKNKYYYGLKITDEKKLMQFFYCDNNIKFIFGESISWPNKKQFVGRITYALTRDELIKSMSKIKESVENLKDMPTKYKNNLNIILGVKDRERQ